jgi:hypothetical protein
MEHLLRDCVDDPFRQPASLRAVHLFSVLELHA